METRTLLDALEDYAASDTLPMHMPGHKRNPLAPYLDTLCARLDITEVAGLDNLHAPQGILLAAQQRAAALWGAQESSFLVNGASGGILAGLYAATRRGDEILLARNAHKSAFHAVELCGLTPRYLLPPRIDGIAGSVSPRAVAQALAQYPNAKLLLLTSPTYEGVLSDIEAIARLCREKGVTLMVDEAHGAHLGLGGGFPRGAVRCGADLVVQSLHKTLPSLTQTAVLHRCSERVDPARLRHALAVFQTSSPSYLLMASIDSCVDLLTREPERLANFSDALHAFDAQTADLHSLVLPLRGALPEGVFACDPSKIRIRAHRRTGYALADALRARFHIEPEMATRDFVLAMTGLGDTPGTLTRLADALRALDASLPPEDAPPEDAPPIPVPALVLAPCEALCAPQTLRPIASCEGCVAAEYVWAYPPGIPLLVPGERIGADTVRALRAALPDTLQSTRAALPQIAVIA